MVIEPGNPGKSGIQGPVASTNRAKTDASAHPNAPKAPADKPSDSVSFSQKAQTMSQLENRVMQSDDVDMAKVDAIRQSIAEGHYTVDSQSIADKMLAQDADF